jgi:hypothetical protein
MFSHVISKVGYKEKNDVKSSCETQGETEAFEIRQEADYQRILLTFTAELSRPEGLNNPAT